VSVTGSGRKVIFGPGRVQVSRAGARGIVASPPPVRSPGDGHGKGRSGGGQGKGRGGNSLAALAQAFGAVSATGAVGSGVVPSPSVPQALTLLSQTIVSVAAPTIDITGISQAYNDLVLVGILRGATAAASTTMTLNFNGLGGAFDVQVVQGAAASASASLGQQIPGQVIDIPAASAAAGDFAVCEITIFGYSDTSHGRNKHGVAVSGAHYSSVNAQARVTSFMLEGSGAVAVNRVTASVSGNFVVGSEIRVYGRL
jgi:hypothetical protein